MLSLIGLENKEGSKANRGGGRGGGNVVDYLTVCTIRNSATRHASDCGARGLFCPIIVHLFKSHSTVRTMNILPLTGYEIYLNLVGPQRELFWQAMPLRNVAKFLYICSCLYGKQSIANVTQAPTV